MTRQFLEFANRIAGKWFLVDTDKVWEFSISFNERDEAHLFIKDTRGNLLETLKYTPIVMNTSTSISINPAVAAHLLIFIDEEQMTLESHFGERLKLRRGKIL